MARVVIAAVWIRAEKVMVARRAPGQSNAGKWEFPGGKLEEGESERACLEREMREEFGITGTAGAHLCDSLYRYDKGEILLRAYLYQKRSGLPIATVHDQMQWADAQALGCLDMTPADLPIARQVADRLREQAE